MESPQRIGQVLWAPTETFRRIGKRPTWLVALVALLILGYSVVARVSKGVAAGLVVAAWLLWVGAKVGLAVAFT